MLQKAPSDGGSLLAAAERELAVKVGAPIFTCASHYLPCHLLHIVLATNETETGILNTEQS